MISCVLGSAMLLAYTHAPVLSAQSAEVAKIDPIHFKTGTYFPPETTTRNLGTYPQHLLVQFTDAYTDQDLLLLESLGAGILSDISRKTILAVFPNPFDPKLVNTIRWTGPIPPHAKISPRISASDGLSSALHYYLLDLHPHVNPASIPAIIKNSGVEVLDRAALPPATHLIRADYPAIKRLSQEDEVSYIYPASDPIINNEPVFFCRIRAGGLGVLPLSVEPGAIGWDGPGLGSAALTYNFTNGTNDVSGSLEQSTVIAGIVEWSRVVDVSFAPTPIQNALNSIQILWATGEHSAASGYDETEYPFDGPGGVVAHASVPVELIDLLDPFSGDIHFDDADNWANGASTQYDLLGVSLHEAGHSLGLFHSDDPDAVMYPTAGIYTELQYDDILSIQLLYATPTALALYTPNGAEIFPSDSTQIIIWAPGDSTGSTVNIALYKNNVFQGHIVTNATNDGFHDWTIPTGLNTSASYSIRIESTSTPGIYDASDAFFKIESTIKTTFSSSDVPITIPNNNFIGTSYASSTITIPSGFSGISDLDLTDIALNFVDISDLRFSLSDPTQTVPSIVQSEGSCASTPITQSSAFGFDDEAADAYGTDCPPLSGKSYRSDIFLFNPHDGINPTGTWTLKIQDMDPTFGSSGTLTNWSLVLESPSSDPGKFSPVYVDPAAASPGAGTQSTPYTIVEPAASTVSTNGQLQIKPGTYTEAPLTISTAMSLQNSTGQGVVKIR